MVIDRLPGREVARSRYARATGSRCVGDRRRHRGWRAAGDRTASRVVVWQEDTASGIPIRRQIGRSDRSQSCRAAYRITADSSIPKHALSSTFPICLEGPIRFPLTGSAVRDRAETFHLSLPDTDMRKVGPGECGILRRPEKCCREAVLAQRLPTSGWYAADQMGKVELRAGYVAGHPGGMGAA